MAQRIFNEFSKGDTVAFWITITVGIALFICVVMLFIKYTAITY